MKKKILFLEDDALLGETLSEDLSEYGYSIEWVKDAHEAIDKSYENRYDLYLFDVNVSSMSGFELLDLLRKSGDDTPCIFLTARSSIDDLKCGFNSGADDYIIKPFDIEVLLIRLEAKIKDKKLFINNSLALDMEGYMIISEKGVITPAKKEFEILKYFVKHKNKIVSKDEIITELYEDEYISDSTFRVYIKNLNSYLKPFAKLTNIRGVGYRFEIV